MTLLAALLAGFAAWWAAGGARASLARLRVARGAARTSRAPGHGDAAVLRREALGLSEALAQELRAGRGWAEALRRAADPRCRSGLSRLARAPDPVAALEVLAQAPGGERLAALVAAGQLAERLGAAPALVVEGVAASLRADAALRRAVRVELAPALATARLLAGLPVLGLALGAALGGDPLGVLLTTAAGRACLLAAVVLEAAGIGWCARLRQAALQ